jgi:hypothetical protein
VNLGHTQKAANTQLALTGHSCPACSSSQVSWTGTSAAALGPATPSSYAPALQPGASLGVAATTQQSLSTLQQQQTPATDPSAVPQVKRQDKVSHCCFVLFFSKIRVSGRRGLNKEEALGKQMYVGFDGWADEG